METGSLWSCVVFTYHYGELDRILAAAQLQLERAHGSPIDLFLYLKSHLVDSFRLRPTLNLLKPHMKQLRSLTARLHSVEKLESLLECCLAHGTTGSLSWLEIFEERMPLPLFHYAHSQTLARIDEYLQSVRILKLRGTTIAWRCAAFEQPDELWIEDLPTFQCPNLIQLAEVISASPRLRSLCLEKMSIHETKAAISLPLKLEHLKRITLVDLGDSSSCRALSLLSLGRQTLNLAVVANFNSLTVLAALRQFASENCVESFRFMDRSNDQPLQEILESLHDLTYLLVDNLRLGKPHLDILANRNRIPPVSLSSSIAQINSARTFPKLKKLTLSQ